MSKRMSGKNNPAYGKDYSSHRNYSKEYRPKGKDHAKARAVIQMDYDGNVLQTFDTITDVAKYLGKEQAKDISNVVKCCKGLRNKAYGYMWKYAERR